jgi:cytochrome c biogenesis protein CcmG, thiol:disulfide interchange protein DsbE
LDLRIGPSRFRNPFITHIAFVCLVLLAEACEKATREDWGVLTSPARRRLVRVVVALVPAVAFLALLSFGVLRAEGPPAPGDEAPAFSAPVLGAERTLSLRDFRGRAVVLNFWASWCEPCRDEAPMLNSAADRYGERIHVVGVNIRDSRDDALAFARRNEYSFPSVVDDDLAIYHDYGLTGQPETFVIDDEGRVFAHVQGPFVSESDLFGLIEGVLRRDG